jgi:hypothetical protein
MPGRSGAAHYAGELPVRSGTTMPRTRPTLSFATSPVNGINPVAYLADVLLRVQTHPASRIDELLPHNWKPPAGQPSA